MYLVFSANIGKITLHLTTFSKRAMLSKTYLAVQESADFSVRSEKFSLGKSPLIVGLD